MSAFSFSVNPVGLAAIMHSTDMHAFVADKVNTVLANARSGAPVASGDYLDSLGSTPPVDTPTTVRGEVWSSSSFWHLVEFGSINNHAYHLLERACTAAGLKFTDSR